MSASPPSPALLQAAEAVLAAEALLVTAGAGLGVDSGLPDFRGDQGFWRAYPAYQKLGLNFAALANPHWFHRDPKLAWGFYGHRLNLYRRTQPHPGFDVLRRLAARMPRKSYVFTSNVDGQFQKAGFPDDRVVEVHGGIEYLQCLALCRPFIFRAPLPPTPDADAVTVDPQTFTAAEPLPRCPECGGLARPNILMFNDWDWADGCTRMQMARLQEWRGKARHPMVIEIGAGSAIATVRAFAQDLGTPMIRINPGEWAVPRLHDVGIPVGALEAIGGMTRALHGHAGGVARSGRDQT
jgi:NAD-dependent SIR2 family protein deacetylase